MNSFEISSTTPVVLLDWFNGSFKGSAVERTRKTFGQMRPLFLSGDVSSLSDDIELYSVEWMGTDNIGTNGALLFGSTALRPGKVDGEYFMTHGHFHRDRSRDEVYFTASGEGLLLRMTEDGYTWADAMRPGSVHAIRGIHAHRVVNTGSEPLIFWASWPADAGYDYEAIRARGFGLRVFERDGTVVLLGCDAV